MIQKETIVKLIEKYLSDNSLFLVDAVVSPDNDIEVTFDSMDKVDLKNCIEMSKTIEAGLDRELEDFSLTVTSAGLDQPFKVFRQYQKFIGKEVEVVFKSGNKQKAILTDAREDSIELSFFKNEKVEGKKKKEKIEVRQFYSLNEIKSTKPVINFK
ncbi:MAG: ribosome assembly cofactor RimP [Bacteroidales bacterium]|nr:ribosome assembly cofactor RimP [Bacteroidales bacterium]MDD2281306.1 ribosome assembly cofactor RimP [Bacteroidales bacterium]MDD4293495.1 ribosome assembly cofactor RimP [Bacteroidales bacterium]MDD4491305.1 ribosome assembly cofactor RimP [Bacteroidales bacterium]HNW48545.1 ribosome assembly cofactor RimP [Bacteroidales bacterium]